LALFKQEADILAGFKVEYPVAAVNGCYIDIIAAPVGYIDILIFGYLADHIACKELVKALLNHIPVYSGALTDQI
jgi:hypothetical protein